MSVINTSGEVCNNLQLNTEIAVLTGSDFGLMAVITL